MLTAGRGRRYGERAGAMVCERRRLNCFTATFSATTPAPATPHAGVVRSRNRTSSDHPSTRAARCARRSSSWPSSSWASSTSRCTSFPWSPLPLSSGSALCTSQPCGGPVPVSCTTRRAAPLSRSRSCSKRVSSSASSTPPTRLWVYLRLGRWDIGVRTDTFQITNWVWGNRRRATSAFFHSADCVMWQGNADGRDCIVVSGPTYLRSKVEFALSTEGGNADAWNALALSGVRALPGPPDATTPDPSSPASVAGAAPRPLSPSANAGPAPLAAPAKGFRRLGQDLGSRRARAATPQDGSSPSTGPLPADVPMRAPSSWSGRGRGKPPLPARMSPVAIVGLVLAAVALLSLPSLLALSQHGVGVSPNLGPDSVSTPRPALPPVETTQCTLNATRTLTAWTGTARATDPLADVTEDQLPALCVPPRRQPSRLDRGRRAPLEIGSQRTR